MELCKTDMQRIIKYLEDAATLYDAQAAQRHKCRAHMIKQLILKLKKKQYEQKRIG